MSDRQSYIYYDQEHKMFRAWEIQFGSWEHYPLASSESLPELMRTYPQAMVNENTHRFWEERNRNATQGS